jgi:hypothetical protein
MKMKSIFIPIDRSMKCHGIVMKKG